MLEVEALAKTFLPPSPLLRPLVRVAATKPVHALNGVSLSVAPGEIVGLLGPNGAGKTTLIKVIATLLHPTSGRALVDGHDVVTEAQTVRDRIGLMLADERGLYWRLSGRRNLEFFGVLAGLRRPVAQQRAIELLEMVGLDDPDRLVFGYSTGMRTRLNLARALLADPRLIVLDEPTRSLDPVASQWVATLLRRLAGEGRAVLFSSHRLDEVAALCDRVVVIVDGTVRHAGVPQDLAGGDGARGLARLLADQGAER